MAKSDYLEDMLLDAIFNAGTFSAPAGTYVSLHSTNPGETGGGAELSGGGYAREEVTSWTVVNNHTRANAADIDFTESTGSQGTATHFGIWTASVGGDLLYYGALDTSRAIDAAGITIVIPAGDLVVTES